jgi:CheY-like chemotaxis protein
MFGQSASHDSSPAVLIVDDEPLIRMSAADSLADAGVTPFEAADGGEALELIEEHPEIALIVTDVEMPGMDGVTLARRACTLRPGLGIIVTSARGEATRPDLPRGGAFLAKPYATRQLLALIRDKLGLAH